MSIEVVPTCPLGHTCEEVRDGKIYRCRWYVQVAGENPQTGEKVDTWDCAIAWGPVLAVEQARTNRGQTAALESFRNEMVAGQDTFARLVQAAAQKRLPNDN